MGANKWLKGALEFLNIDVPNFLDLCEQNVRSLEELVKAGDLLNQRQCQDLSSKLSKTTLNVRKLVECCGVSAGDFRPALKNLYRCLEKARILVANCGEEKWWVAAVFQNRNQNAFREILLEVSLGYNVIYEHAKSRFKDGNVELPDDLRSVFVPAIASDVQEDQQDLQRRLEGLASDPSTVIFQGHSLAEDVALKAQSLARYLQKMQCAFEQSSVATTSDGWSGIMWNKETEPAGTWGQSQYLGSGATDGGVCKTEWLEIPCARKEYHVKEHEVFFLKEASILAHVKHPCIIDFVCCSNGQSRGDRFIAMELMQKSLCDLIEDQKSVNFPLHVAVDIIVQIARGMSYLHDQGVAHRDLKPQNVVVSRLDSSSVEDLYCVKLVDFGLSKTKVDTLKSTTVTAQGIGTTMYRAPELHPKASLRRKGRAMWMKADVFSFAMTCVHFLTLDVPFKGFTSDELYNAVMNGQRPKLPKDCPEELVALLKDCWNAIPDKRPSFTEICVRLETLRLKDLRGRYMKMELGSSLVFIKVKIEEQSSFYKNLQTIVCGINDIEEVNQCLTMFVLCV